MLRAEKANGLQQDDQEACKGDSSALDKIAIDIDDQPLSAWVRGLHPRLVSKRHSCCNPPDQHDESSVALTQLVVVNDYQQDWRFIKRSPIWDKIPSLEAYQTPVQKPHFSPLNKVNTNCREGLAICYMVTFGNLVEDIQNIQLSATPNIIKDMLETLDELETHGFDVGSIRARLNEFGTFKMCQLKRNLKKVENDLKKNTQEKSAIEEGISQLKVQIVELSQKMVQAETMKNLKDEELERLQCSLDIISMEIENWANATSL